MESSMFNIKFFKNNFLFFLNVVNRPRYLSGKFLIGAPMKAFTFILSSINTYFISKVWGINCFMFALKKVAHMI